MLNDGIRALQILFGMRIANGYVDDSEVLKAFEKSWLINLKSITKALGKTKIAQYEAFYKAKASKRSSPRLKKNLEISI